MISPQILIENAYKLEDIERLLDEHDGLKIIDIYNQQLDELFEVLYPASNDKKQLESFKADRRQPNAKLRGSWVYLPWDNQLLHILNQAELRLLLTNRNQQLITQTEQAKLAAAKVVILGLSVGSGIASALAHSGIADELVLADYDSFSTTNLNRVRVGLGAVEHLKLEVSCQELYEVNPFLKIQAHQAGITQDNLKELLKPDGPTIIFDEMDDFAMKIKVRQQAKEQKTAVVMLTSLGDNLLVDVERYDNEQNVRPFNGQMGDVDPNSLDQIDEATMKRLSTKTVGIENVPTRALESLRDIGSKLVGRPQLYGTVVLDGGFAAYICRQIILGQDLPSGRYRFSYADVFGLPRNDLALTPERQTILGSLGGKSSE